MCLTCNPAFTEALRRFFSVPPTDSEIRRRSNGQRHRLRGGWPGQCHRRSRVASGHGRPTQEKLAASDENFQEGLFWEQSPFASAPISASVLCPLSRRSQSKRPTRCDWRTKTGSIVPGKLANFTVLADNPLAVDPSKIKDIAVVATVQEGRVLPVN